MKNKKGFTLVELIAVIVILALVITIAVPSTIGITKRLKKNMFCSKIDFIENAAKLYGEDNRNDFTNEKIIKVIDLVNDSYLKKDHNTTPYVEDPRDKSSLDEMSLTIYKKNKRIYIGFSDIVNNTCNRQKYNPDQEEKPGIENIPVIINRVTFDSSTGFKITDNYLYTNTLSDPGTILGRLNYPDGDLSIENNRLHIKSSTGDVKAIQIISLSGSSNDFFIGPNDISVKAGTNIENFVSSIKCVNCQIEINERVSNTIKTSGVFESRYYYYDVLIYTNDANRTLVTEKHINIF